MSKYDEANELAEQRGILPHTFNCVHYEQCNHLASGQLGAGNGCTLSNIGIYFGSLEEVKRIAVTGLDHGRHSSGDYFHRSLGIHQHYVVDGNLFNSHYQGVVRTAAAFLGTFGNDCKQGCWSQRSCRKALDRSITNCVLEHIFQPNIVKCVKDHGGGMGYGGAALEENCSHHLLAELLMLDLRVVIMHGVKTINRLRNVLIGQNIPLDSINIPRARQNNHFYVAQFDMYVFCFVHPSYNRLNNEWDVDVLPCLNYLSGIGVIT